MSGEPPFSGAQSSGDNGGCAPRFFGAPRCAVPWGVFICSECAESFEEAGFCPHHGVRLGSQLANPLLGLDVGSFRIAGVLGAGGTGTAYLAINRNIGSRVAIKVLSMEASRDTVMVKRFLDEARAVNLIRHECIVNILDFLSLPDGRPAIVMEYLDGSSLRQRMDDHSLSVADLASVMVYTLEALHAGHERDIVHRDLKPANIYVTRKGRPKILDYGIAKLQNQTLSETDTGALLGSPYYLSPELAAGKLVDRRTDIYSAGVILYEGLCGTRPFTSDNIYELLVAHTSASPPAPASHGVSLPRDVEAIVMRALEKDAGARFQTAENMAGALREAYGIRRRARRSRRSVPPSRSNGDE